MADPTADEAARAAILAILTSGAQTYTLPSGMSKTALSMDSIKAARALLKDLDNALANESSDLVVTQADFRA